MNSPVAAGRLRRIVWGLSLAAVALVPRAARPVPAEATESAERPPAAYPEADRLLASVMAGLPDVPIRIATQLQSRRRDGTLDRKLNAEMVLDWRGRSPSAKYTVKDAFGGTLEGLNIRWLAGGKRDARYFKGDPLVAAARPSLDSPVAGTDISWIDLSLSFLWWTGGRTVGSETIKGRFCYMVDLPAPPKEAATYAGVRLWIDPQIRILLQAAAYDRAGQLVKLLEVKSFRKVRGVWVIQNIDVETLPSRHKTSLRVRQVEVLAPGAKDQPRKSSSAGRVTFGMAEGEGIGYHGGQEVNALPPCGVQCA
ncbi:MAG: outer membrane lipoprotein-sorting protein [Verrucomicrobiota bacterium]